MRMPRSSRSTSRTTSDPRAKGPTSPNRCGGGRSKFGWANVPRLTSPRSRTTARTPSRSSTAPRASVRSRLFAGAWPASAHSCTRAVSTIGSRAADRASARSRSASDPGSQLFDLTSYTRHIGRDTTGDLLSKGVFLGRSRGYIKGLIEIQRTAHGTDSFLGEFSMLLDRKARSVTIPSLEIDQPDVRRAAHSSSAGPIDEIAGLLPHEPRHRPRDRAQVHRPRLPRAGGGAGPAGGRAGPPAPAPRSEVARRLRGSATAA